MQYILKRWFRVAAQRILNRLCEIQGTPAEERRTRRSIRRRKRRKGVGVETHLHRIRLAAKTAQGTICRITGEIFRTKGDLLCSRLASNSGRVDDRYEMKKARETAHDGEMHSGKRPYTSESAATFPRRFSRCRLQTGWQSAYCRNEGPSDRCSANNAIGGEERMEER